MSKNYYLKDQYFQLNDKFNGFMDAAVDYISDMVCHEVGSNVWSRYMHVNEKWKQDLYDLFYELEMDWSEAAIDELAMDYAKRVRSELSEDRCCSYVCMKCLGMSNADFM